MTKLLNFNQDRKLDFDANRDLHFSPNRELSFHLNRELSFDQDRDLGFGQRGAVFRGYVCSSCGALVNPLATECDECGAVFETERPKKAVKKPKKKVGFKRRFCLYCGHPITSSDVYCSHCGLRLPSGARKKIRSRSKTSRKFEYDVLKLPRKERKKIVADWKETGKDFEAFLEE